jgi:hypothetical protein
MSRGGFSLGEPATLAPAHYKPVTDAIAKELS